MAPTWDVLENPDNDEEENPVDTEEWYPCGILSRTNWLYQVDTLRPHDICEMGILRELCELLEGYATQFIIWAYSLRSIISFTSDNVYAQKLEAVVKLIIRMAEIF